MHTENRRKLIGVVVSDKMDKSVTVQVETKVIHPVVHKHIRRSKKYLAHDQNNQCGIGDRVQIIETRPLSKRKRWSVVQVVEKAS